MRVRYENWVNGLTGDWLVSRQRFFGVPLPVWYPLDADANPVFDQPIVATRELLPVDPSSDTAPGYTADQRGVANGFIGEVDVMDTWATSSLTPQLAAGWERDPELFNLVFPYSLRPQGQDIIRTWLFSTVLRSELEHGVSPWGHTALSGFIVDPDRKKMSKSKGNVVTPADMLEQHGSDAVRYWAASSRLGTDAAFDPTNPTQIKIGRRLAIKILNASKFILTFDGGADAPVTVPLDQSMLARLSQVVSQATTAFDNYDHARALELTESFFWTFCDDYLELVKDRAYGEASEDRASAVAALRTALSALLRLFAPFVPFATEEAWSWTNDSSIHLASWPVATEVSTDGVGNAALLDLASRALTSIRRAKTDAKASQKAAVTSASISGSSAEIELLAQASADLKAVGRIDELSFVVGPELAVTDIVLASVDAG
jgi:valyl-tRNA synthetase